MGYFSSITKLLILSCWLEKSLRTFLKFEHLRSEFRLQFVYMLFIVNIRIDLTHSPGFLLLLLLPWLIEIPAFICTNKINLPHLKWCSNRLVIAVTVVPVFKNVWKMSTIKNYHPVSLLSVVVDYLEKCDLFSDFSYGFISSYSAVDLLTVADLLAFNRATQIIALDRSKVFDWVWNACLLYTLNSIFMEFLWSRVWPYFVFSK